MSKTEKAKFIKLKLKEISISEIKIWIKKNKDLVFILSITLIMIFSGILVYKLGDRNITVNIKNQTNSNSKKISANNPESKITLVTETPIPTPDLSNYKSYEDNFIKFYYPIDFNVKVNSGEKIQINTTKPFQYASGVNSIEMSSKDGNYSFKQILVGSNTSQGDDQYNSLSNIYKEFDKIILISVSKQLVNYSIGKLIYLVVVDDVNIKSQSYKPKTFPRIMISYKFVDDFYGAKFDSGNIAGTSSAFTYLSANPEKAENKKLIDTVQTDIKCGGMLNEEMTKCQDFLKTFLQTVSRK